MSYDRRTADDNFVPKLDRLIDSIERELKQMRSSLDKYKQDPGKYKPQLDNLANAARNASHAAEVIDRTIERNNK